MMAAFEQSPREPTIPVCLGLRVVLKWDSPEQIKGLITLVVLHDLISSKAYTLATTENEV